MINVSDRLFLVWTVDPLNVAFSPCSAYVVYLSSVKVIEEREPYEKLPYSREILAKVSFQIRGQGVRKFLTADFKAL